MNEVQAVIIGEVIGVQGHKDSSKDVAYAYVKNGMRIYNIAGRRSVINESLMNKNVKMDCRVSIYEKKTGGNVLQVWCYTVL